jgi:hypothetical protein
VRNQLTFEQVVVGAVVAATIAFAFGGPYLELNELASCKTDKPVNVVLCVDLGVGGHSLLPAWNDSTDARAGQQSQARLPRPSGQSQTTAPVIN